MGFFYFLLAIGLIGASIHIQGRYLDSEAVTYLGNYLYYKPFWSKVFNIQLNEGGVFRAREPAYLVDIIDANIIKTLVQKGVIFFILISTYYSY